MTAPCKAKPASHHLEDELDCSLHQSRRGRAHNRSERRAVDVAVHRSRSIELRGVEDVESLEAELQRLRFSERHALQQSHVVVVDARAGEESALGVAGIAQGLQAK